MPAKSKAQLGMMFHLEDIGEVPKGTGRHWARETKKLKGGITGLPEHVKKSAVIRNRGEDIADFVSQLVKQAGPPTAGPPQPFVGPMRPVDSDRASSVPSRRAAGTARDAPHDSMDYVAERPTFGGPAPKPLNQNDDRLFRGGTLTRGDRGEAIPPHLQVGYRPPPTAGGGAQASASPGTDVISSLLFSPGAQAQQPQMPPWPTMAAGVAGTGVLGAMLGAPLGAGMGAFRGNTAEGLGRGVVRGGMTGAGAGIGGLIAALLADKVSPGSRESGIPGLVGAGLGGLGGYAAGGAMLGEPAGAGKKKDEEKTAAQKFAESLFKRSTVGTSVSGGASAGGGVSAGAAAPKGPALAATGTRAPLGGIPSGPIAPKTTITAAPSPMMGMAATVGS